MKAIDYVILAAILVCIILAFHAIRKRRKKGGCCCMGCSGDCTRCTAKKQEPKEKE